MKIYPFTFTALSEPHPQLPAWYYTYLTRGVCPSLCVSPAPTPLLELASSSS